MTKSTETIVGNANDVSDDVKAFGRDVLKLANSVGAEAQARATNLGGEARDQTKAAYDTVRAQVSSNPAIALGAAMGVGLLFGFLLKGRH